MKKILSVCAVAGALSLCAAPAFAQSTVNMVATLTGAEETPAPGVNTGAAGSARVHVDIVNEELSVTLIVVNLPAASTAGHIHIAPKGLAGPVVLDFPIPAGRTGDLSLTFRVGASAFRTQPAIGIVTMTDAIQSIINGNAYVNVHTTANPAGEIRGQLTLER
jgi:hypothetical protein